MLDRSYKSTQVTIPSQLSLDTPFGRLEKTVETVFEHENLTKRAILMIQTTFWR